MFLRSALLSALLVATSDARAADTSVVMVEPETADYVRGCDVYGKGYLYIPGTETCLIAGGYIRMRVQGADREFNDDIDFDGVPGTGLNRRDDYTIGTRTRARLEFDARKD